jgi:general secretion pathway protein J
MSIFPDRKGFTLIELLVAVALLSIILTAVYSSFFLADRAIETSGESLVRMQEIRRAVDILKCELDSSFFDPQREWTFLKMKDRDVRGEEMSSLAFTGFSNVKSGLSRISYWVEEEDGGLVLVKSIGAPYRKSEQDLKAVMMDGIEEFRIEAKFSDEWVATWDTTVNNELPEEFRISLSASSGGRRLRLQEFSRPRTGREL